MQRVIITKEEDRITNWLDSGWKVKSVTAQEIAGGAGASYGFETGKFCFVLEKN